MAWKDARGSTRVVVTGVRHVAHSDDAKSRTHDASQLARRGFPRRLLVGGAALTLVVAGAVTVMALNGRGDATPRRIAAVGSTAESASPSAEPAVVSPEDLMNQSQPTGVWRLRGRGRSSVKRSGDTAKEHYKTTTATWTFDSRSCTPKGCAGRITSTSGSTFDYSWNGKKLVVVRKNVTSTTKKLQCFDDVTGDPAPISEAAAVDSYRYSFGPFTGSATRMTSQVVVHVSTEFFGTCKASPDDTVKFLEEQVITQQRAS